MTSSHAAHERLVIIGSGPAGYTAAIYAARAMLKPLLLSGYEPGGQLMITTDVENYPGFAEPIQGPWLMEQMRAQAENVGARVENEYVVALELKSRPFVVRCDSGRAILADAIILATGAKAKWLGLPSEEKFKGFGVSACATCDGFFFRKQVGGGRRRRQFRGRGGALPVQHRLRGDGRPSPRLVPGREDPERTPRRAPQREDPLGQRRRGDSRRRRAGGGHRRQDPQRPHRRARRPRRPTACSSRSATRRRPNSCAARSC